MMATPIRRGLSIADLLEDYEAPMLTTTELCAGDIDCGPVGDEDLSPSRFYNRGSTRSESAPAAALRLVYDISDSASETSVNLEEGHHRRFGSLPTSVSENLMMSGSRIPVSTRSRNPPLATSESPYAALERQREKSIRVVQPDYSLRTESNSTANTTKTPGGHSSEAPANSEHGRSLTRFATQRSGVERDPVVECAAADNGESSSPMVKTEPDDNNQMPSRFMFADSDDDNHATMPVTTAAPTRKYRRQLSGIGRALERAIRGSLSTTPLLRSEDEREAGGKNAKPSTGGSIQRRAKPGPLNLVGPSTKKVEIDAHHGAEHKNGKADSLPSPQRGWDSLPTGSSMYDEENNGPPPTDSIYVPQSSPVGLDYYHQWRAEQPSLTASQRSVHVNLGANQQYLVPDSPGINGPSYYDNHAHGAMDIRDEYNGDAYLHQSSDYSTMPSEADTPRLRQGILRSRTTNDLPRARESSDHGDSSLASQGANDAESPPQTPLTPFIRAMTGGRSDVCHYKKTLIGERGWLEDTAAADNEEPAAQVPKTEKSGGFMDSVKRKAREFAESTSLKQPRAANPTPVSQMKISLNAREQSLLYCELEYNLSMAVEAYLKAQFDNGRLDTTKLSRIATAWADKGRPKVVGFRYDLETQMDLITAHTHEFRFYGSIQTDTVRISGLLHAVKMDARCMRIRTYCQPDSLIAKHILDAQRLAQVLGADEALQRPIEEVAQFFHVAVDRHKVMADIAERDSQKAENSRTTGSQNGSATRVHFQDELPDDNRKYSVLPESRRARPALYNDGYAARVAVARGEGQGVSHRNAGDSSGDNGYAVTRDDSPHAL